MNYLLIAVIVLIGMCVLQGYRKGFLRIMVSLLWIALVIAAVFWLSPYVSDFLIHHSSAYDKVEEKITTLVEIGGHVDLTDETVQEESIDAMELPGLLKSALHQNNTEEVYREYMVEAFSGYISGFLTRLVLKAASFIGVFLLVGLLAFIAMRAADLISRIPIIKGFNRLLGVAAGLVLALAIIWVFFFVVVMFLGSGFGDRLMADIKQSAFLTFLFDQNLLMELIM